MRGGRSIRFLGLAVVSALATVFALIAVRATAATPTPSTLTFDGAHFSDSTLPGGLRHDGRFAASAPFCSAGRAYDVRHMVMEPLTVLRMHTCDDGSGSFTALMPVVRSEHGGTGTWKIVEGTGRYETLRGFGRYTGTLVSGDANAYDTIVYRTAWQGVVDFDADPPAIEKFTATARKVPARVRAYALRVTLGLRDAAGPVSYAADVRSGGVVLGSRQGSTSSGVATISFRIRPGRARSARIVITAQDAVGNEAGASTSVGLR